MSSDLGGAQRLLAHLSTDKPLYRPGEVIYGRAALLDAFTHAPHAGPTALLFEVRSPRGDVVYSLPTSDKDGVAPFSWTLPEGSTGGEYKLCVKFPQAGYPPAELAFDVRAYRVPRLKTELEFVRKAYGPGDTVAAALQVTRAEGGVPTGAPVTAVATVDGVEVHRQELTLDAAGGCSVRFALPDTIGDGEGTLAMIVRDGGVQETTARTIPIIVSRVRLTFYPEGGELVVGLPTRLYFEARTPKGKPADVAGRIVDGAGHELASFRSEHEGRGFVTLTPGRAGKVYLARLDEPAGVADLFPLPEVLAKGYVVGAVGDEPLSGVAGAPVQLRVAATIAGAARVTLSSRERELCALPLKLVAGQPQEVTLTPGVTAEGALRATVFDGSGVARAERLLFLRPARQVRVEVTPDRERARLRDKVSVDVRTTDADGAPVAATVALSVVDDAVLETVERRERAPRLPVQVLLQSEVAELMDTEVYLKDEPQAQRRVDLLLGTQGWRRFAFFHIDRFLGEHKDAAERALARRRDIPPPPPMLDIPMMMPQARGGMRFRAAAPMMAMAPPMMPGGPPPPAPAGAVMAAAPAVDQMLGGMDLEGAGAAPPPEEEVVARADDQAPLKEEAWAEAPLAAQAAMPMPMADMPAPMAGAPVPMEIQAQAQAMFAPEAPAEKKGLLGKIADFFAGKPAAPAPMPPAMMRRMPRPPMPPMPPPPVLAVREYAHRAAPSGKGGRADFAETLYWNAGLVTDASGEASFSFELADSVTTFRVRADAFGKDGALGAGDGAVEARRAFYLEPKLPLEVTAGDELDVPVAIVNGGDQELTAQVEVAVTGPVAVAAGAAAQRLELKPEGRGRVVLPLVAQAGQAAGEVKISARAGSARDSVTRRFDVAPLGFPVEISLGGQLDGSARHKVRIPAGISPGSLLTEAIVYPSPMASLAQAVEALLREPCGCFEQTSSSTYPNVMVMQYLTTHTGADPAIARRAKGLLETGYKRLTSYECKEKGYEWFGGDPGHEALTAYGLMEFTDMAQVHAVDADMLRRTRAWLLSRRDGKGGFLRNDRALDTFGRAPEDITDAYIAWALLQSKEAGLEKEVARVAERAIKSGDPYLLALSANVLLDAEKKGPAGEVLARLLKHQGKDGAVTGAKTSVTGSGGESLDIETTALTILALLRAPEYTAQCERAMRWLLERCKSGRFGATQSTILALKAIVAYDAAHAAARRPGMVSLFVDGKSVAEARFTTEQQGPIVLVSFASALSPGEHELELRMTGGSPMPYSVQVRYHAQTPASAAGCKLGLVTKLARAEAAEGETVDLLVTLSNQAAEGVPMAVAIIGLPGGLEARTDQLKELVKEGKIDFFETRGREVILYRRGMAPKERSELRLTLVAAVPGRYTGPASRAYLYYTDEDKVWAEPVTIRIR